MIPKIIHFVWLGENPKPSLVLKCIETWKRYCPDYKIMEWNDEAVRDIDNTYFLETLRLKKYAFASDYIRLYALNKYGGLYFDSDLELTNNLDPFLSSDFFTGFEKYEETFSPVTALMGSVPNGKLINELLSYYDNRSFIDEDGEPILIPNTKVISNYITNNLKIPVCDTDALKGIKIDENSKIYPYFYFCTPKLGERNFSIHHFSGSWVESFKRATILKFGLFCFLKFKRVNNKRLYPSLREGEKKIFSFKLRGKYYMLIRRLVV